MNIQTKTQAWFSDDELERVYERYRQSFWPKPLGYATAEDFCDSFDHLRPLATASGDLKDVQRPWVLKVLLGAVPRGARILEIGAGEPWVADLLSRLGYEVWVVDPYDGSGNGPDAYELFSAQCPAIHFVRNQFSDQLGESLNREFDCIYSISVLEHVPELGLYGVAAGIRKLLKPNGINLHAIDHVQRGAEAAWHLDHLNRIACLFGLPLEELEVVLESANSDPETYFLSTESHNRWRGSRPYREFPMRVCVSFQIFSHASSLLSASHVISAGKASAESRVSS